MDKMKRNILIFALIQSLSFSSMAQSAKIVSGFKGIQQMTIQLAMVIGPIAFIIAGLIFYFNKQEGSDKFSGVFIGTVIIGASSTLFTMIYSLFN